MIFLKKKDVIVYTEIPFLRDDEETKKNIPTRGIILNESRCLFDMYNQWIPIYKRYADTTIDCSKKDI